MARDVLGNVGFGGGGQAEDRRRRFVARLFADEASHIAVIGPEIVAPSRQAVRLVEHPAADLALFEHAAQGAGAELLRRHDENAGVSQPHPVERIRPFGHRQHPVDRDAAPDPLRFHPRNLVRHQRDQGRDGDRQRAGLVVARQRRELIAERLARSRRQHAEYVLPRHRRLDDGALHGAPVWGFRRRAEVGEAEPAPQLLAGVVALPAPSASGVGAGGVSEPAHKPPRFRELVAHPGRHDRVPAGDRQPCQRIGQRPARPARFRQGRAPVGGASLGLQPSPYRRARLRVRRAARAAEPGEETVERAVCPLRFRSGQPVPRRQQVRVGVPQGLPLLAEDFQRETGVELRVVRPSGFETAVPIVLDEAVIGIARKGQGAEPQGVHRREVQEPQIGLRRLQVRQVEGDQVVAQHEGGPVGEFVERRKRRRQSFAGTV